VIRINKPSLVPDILRARGRQATRDLCDAYESGERIFDFDRTVYAATSVKKALLKAQHGKCAFCESKITHVEYGDVEHFRPKAGFQQRAKDRLVRPGYYWLAYEWSNLFFSCQLCNQASKKNLFPLRNPRRRARSHRDDLQTERPLLLDPSMVDPETVLSFREETVYAINDNRLGRTTIDVLGLNRQELREARRERFELIQLLLVAKARYLRHVTTLSASTELLDELAQINMRLARMRNETAEYAAMARAACAGSSI
jgi:uncharacterized protein (TIGR02646 family)